MNEDLEYRISRLEGLLDFYSRQEARPGVAGLLGVSDKTKLDSLAHPVQRLSYAATTNLMNGTALAVNTWTDLVPSLTFAVTDTAAFFLMEFRACALVLAGGIVTSVGCRALIDNTLAVLLPGTVVNPSMYGALELGAVIQANNFAAGNHTVKVQIEASQAATGYCRAAGGNPYEFANVVITEYAP